MAPTIRNGSVPGGDRFGQRSIRQFVREILLAGEEPDERAARCVTMVADRPPQHRIPGFERVEYRALRDWALERRASPHRHTRQASANVPEAQP